MESHILNLPTELLLAIFHSLYPVTQHTFALSCRRLYFTFAPLCPKLYSTERDVVRIRLARDGFPFHYHAYCHGCRFVHMLRFFSPDQLEKPPTSRLCSSSLEQLWVEPGKVYYFGDIQPEKRMFLPRANLNKLPKPNCSTIMRLCTTDMGVFWTEQFAICASYDILTLPVSKEATKAEIVKLLQGFDIPTCPHTRLGDPAVANSYVPSIHSASKPAGNLAVWVGQVEGEGADAWCKFPGCKTLFRWACSPSSKRENWKILSIHVKRHLGTLLSPINPRWMAQLATVPNEAYMEAYWKDCHQWKDVNMAIEERRYDRELRNEDVALSREEQLEFEQLRRENDYLCHPHRRKMYPRSVLDLPSEFRDLEQPSDELPTTTLFLVGAEQGRPGQNNNKRRQNRAQPSDWNASIVDPELEDGMYIPQYSPDAVLESIQRHTKFVSVFKAIKALPPIRRKLENFFWAAVDCVSIYGGLLGLLIPFKIPYVTPRRQFVLDQLYHLPFSVKRALLNFDEAEGNDLAY
ncbi:uncharacterized protein BJX67DRAFT_364268 [Aspergillus lucknowensis]|uniref:F-box domain-containing protein n=1 Tax=Aspergillus lucknowensis TaxID=176173 RepID=A0ABR4LFC6_9EURO